MKELEMKYLVLKLSKSVDLDFLSERIESMKDNLEIPITTWRELALILLNCEIEE